MDPLYIGSFTATTHQEKGIIILESNPSRGTVLPAPHGKGNKCNKNVKYKRTDALSLWHQQWVNSIQLTAIFTTLITLNSKILKQISTILSMGYCLFLVENKSLCQENFPLDIAVFSWLFSTKINEKNKWGSIDRKSPNSCRKQVQVSSKFSLDLDIFTEKVTKSNMFTKFNNGFLQYFHQVCRSCYLSL